MVETTGAVDFTFMNESIEMLGMFEENPKAAVAMVKAMHKLEDRTNKIHITLVKNLNKVRAKDQVLALLDLYEVAKSNMSRTERLLAETLGALDDSRVIPILATIAKTACSNRQRRCGQFRQPSARWAAPPGSRATRGWAC